MDRLSFQVADFDAPLDLILHLLSKHKLDIMDIDISSLLEQYLATIESWQEANLDVTSEFLEMASRLVYMKTVSLLPKKEKESEQLRRDLSGELMEYHICKVAAELLGEDNHHSDIFVRDPMDIELDQTYCHIHPTSILYQALISAMGREGKKRPLTMENFDPLVRKPFVSVSTKIFSVLKKIKREKQVDLDDLFDIEMGRSGLVATFLAILELMKSGGIYLQENNTLTLGKSA